MAEIDISYWARQRIEEVSQELLKKVSRKADWEWKVEFHNNPDDESRTLDHWTLTGESKMHRLSIMMYLGRVPWTTRWKLYFKKDGKKYSCLEEKFQEIRALKDLEIALDKIGRQVKKNQDAEDKQNRKNADKSLRRKQEQEARELTASLRR